MFHYPRVKYKSARECKRLCYDLSLLKIGVIMSLLTKSILNLSCILAILLGSTSCFAAYQFNYHAPRSVLNLERELGLYTNDFIRIYVYNQNDKLKWWSKESIKVHQNQHGVYSGKEPQIFVEVYNTMHRVIKAPVKQPRPFDVLFWSGTIAQGQNLNCTLKHHVQGLAIGIDCSVA